MTGAEAAQIAKLLNNRNHLVRQYTELLGSANEAHFSAQQPIAVGEIAHLETGAAGVLVSSDRASGAGAGAGAGAAGGLATGFGTGRYSGPFRPHAGSRAASSSSTTNLRMGFRA